MPEYIQKDFQAKFRVSFILTKTILQKDLSRLDLFLALTVIIISGVIVVAESHALFFDILS